MATAITPHQQKRELVTMIRSDDAARAIIEPFLPRGVTLEQIAATVAIAVNKEPKLLNCEPASVVLGVARIASWGLSLGETAHLLPMGKSCVPVKDYKGEIECLVRAGAIRDAEAYCIYEHETFRLIRGASTDVHHEPIMDPNARGAMVGAYVIFHLPGNRTRVETMAVAEIDAIRQAKSMSWKSGPLAPWYARKTVVKQGAKFLPKNPALYEILANDDEAAMEIPAALARLGTGETYDTGTGEVIEHRGPKPLVQGGYDDVPTPPAQFSDDPAASAEDFQDDSHLA